MCVSECVCVCTHNGHVEQKVNGVSAQCILDEFSLALYRLNNHLFEPTNEIFRIHILILFHNIQLVAAWICCSFSFRLARQIQMHSQQTVCTPGVCVNVQKRSYIHVNAFDREEISHINIQPGRKTRKQTQPHEYRNNTYAARAAQYFHIRTIPIACTHFFWSSNFISFVILFECALFFLLQMDKMAVSPNFRCYCFRSVSLHLIIMETKTKIAFIVCDYL